MISTRPKAQNYLRWVAQPALRRAVRTLERAIMEARFKKRDIIPFETFQNMRRYVDSQLCRVVQCAGHKLNEEELISLYEGLVRDFLRSEGEFKQIFTAHRIDWFNVIRMLEPMPPSIESKHWASCVLPKAIEAAYGFWRAVKFEVFPRAVIADRLSEELAWLKELYPHRSELELFFNRERPDAWEQLIAERIHDVLQEQQGTERTARAA
jgi:hypothetical protein